MGSDSSSDGASHLLSFFFESHMDEPDQPGSSMRSSRPVPSATISITIPSQDQAHITPAPELRVRQADCSQISQSASQAIQQASQSASQSIQQASQSASQAAQQASQSASQAIQQAQQSAAQSISAASRSAASAASSASSVVSSVQSSAASAIDQASQSMQSAMLSASAAQSDASKAVVQAGAAVAAATGSAAAAGSSFLAAAAKATQSAQSSVSAVGAAAASQIAQASQQVTASQTAAITATQAAVAIVGSIIASALITILIYFLIIRHKDRAKKKSGSEQSPRMQGSLGSGEGKFTTSDQVGTTIAASQSAYEGARNTGSQVSFSLFPKPTVGDDPGRNSMVKTTTVPWDPKNPPKPPSLGSWLRVQNVSPFGSIKLPTDDEKSEGPLGGQLKSPLRTSSSEKSPIPQAPKFLSSLALRSPKIPVLTYKKPSVSTIEQSPSRSVSVKRKPVSPEPEPEKPDTLPQHPAPNQSYRESKASVWTDSLSDEPPSPMLPSPPPELKEKEPASLTKGYEMRIPSVQGPVRNTAEWLQEQSKVVARVVNPTVVSINPRDWEHNRDQIRNPKDRIQNLRNSEQEAWRPNAQRTPQRESQGPWRPNTSYTQPQLSPRRLNLESRPSFGLGLPNGEPGQRGRLGLPSGSRARDIKSLTGEVGYVRGLSRFLDPSPRGSLVSREGSQRSAISRISGISGEKTPGVGKAL